MDKLGDIDLFVRVVKNNGLAAAAREAGLSPASVTFKVNRLEQSYGVRLLNRTTRQISLTDEGRRFYQRCLRIISEVAEAEEELKGGQYAMTGPLSITAPVDLGEQCIAPVLAQFCERHPGVSAHLHLSDGVVNLIEEGFDLGVRYGVLKDSRMIARKLAANRRVLCASPDYVDKYGKPLTPFDLKEHRCLTMKRHGEMLDEWLFNDKDKQIKVQVRSSLSSNDGAQIRRWASKGFGIALKSYWDIQNDLSAQKLVPLLEEYTQDFQAEGIESGSDLNVVYPSKNYLPERTRALIAALVDYFSEQP